MISIVDIASRKYSPKPATIPNAATTHIEAAVVNPDTVSLDLKIVPAPKKPMPVTIPAMILEGSEFTYTSVLIIVNKAAPMDTSISVLIPAGLCAVFLS